VHLLVKRKAESKLLWADLKRFEKVSAILRGAFKRLPSNTTCRKTDLFSFRTSAIVQCLKIKQKLKSVSEALSLYFSPLSSLSLSLSYLNYKTDGSEPTDSVPIDKLFSTLVLLTWFFEHWSVATKIWME
jgi:hypothetical protein